MKRKFIQRFLGLCILIYLIAPSAVLGEELPYLYLQADSDTVSVGHLLTVTLQVENSPQVYGLESHLIFDADLLEVVELKHGTFLSSTPETSTFVLQNRFDNKQGRIDYTLSLLNPAPPVKGNGTLMEIIFRAKADGKPMITIDEALLGAQNGTEITPMVRDQHLTLTTVNGVSTVSENQAPVGSNMTNVTPSSEDNLTLSAGTDGNDTTLSVPSDSSGQALKQTSASSANGVEVDQHPATKSHTTVKDTDLFVGLSLVGIGLFASIIGLAGILGAVGLTGCWLLFSRVNNKTTYNRRK
ncbi:MAG: cohesin domain-containing protein [Chloroflexota bacterium]